MGGGDGEKAYGVEALLSPRASTATSRNDDANGDGHNNSTKSGATTPFAIVSPRASDVGNNNSSNKEEAKAVALHHHKPSAAAAAVVVVEALALAVAFRRWRRTGLSSASACSLVHSPMATSYPCRG